MSCRRPRALAPVFATFAATALSMSSMSAQAGLTGASSVDPYSSDQSKLYTIDPVTGAATPFLTLDRPLSVTGLEYINGSYYATDIVDGSGYAFGRIDPATGAVTILSDQPGDSWYGLARNDSIGHLYATDNSNNLHLVNPYTGASALVGSTGIPATNDNLISSLAYDNVNGVLYSVDYVGNLYTLDTSTGVATTIGSTNLTFTDISHGLAYDPTTATLYLNEADVSDSLYKLNTTTGKATLVGSNGTIPDTGIDGLTFVPETPPPPPEPPTGLIGASSSTPGVLYTVDPATGAARPFLVIDDELSFPGLEFMNGSYYATDIVNGSRYAFGRIDPVTGVVTILNSDQDGSDWRGLARNEAARLLYTVDSNGSILKSIDPATGATTMIGATGVPDLGSGLAYDSVNGILYALAFNGNLYTINVSTGVATPFGPTGLTFADVSHGLAYDPTTHTLYFNEADVFDSLYTLDITPGSSTPGLATLVGSNGLVAGSGIDGLMFLPSPAPVPLPGALLMLLSSLVTLFPGRPRLEKNRSRVPDGLAPKIGA